MQRLAADPVALGIFGYSFLFENSDRLKAVAVDGVVPDADTIASGEYAISRPLFIYVKNAHRGVIPGLDEFLTEYVSEESFGPDGYLPERGLIPLADASARRCARRSPPAPRSTASTEPPRPAARAAGRPPEGTKRCSATSSSTILALSLAAYIVGNATARGFVAADGQPVHSLPSYHGAFVAIWAGVPALVLVLLWLLLQGTVIDGLLVRSLPDALTAAAPSQIELTLSEIHNVAAGRIFAEPSPEVVAAAGRLTRWTAIARLAMFAVAVAAMLLGLFFARGRLAPRFRARNGVERAISVFMVACSVIAILTTVGIVVSLALRGLGASSRWCRRPTSSSA